ncbi:MAG TPA: hypothetical protein VGO40_17225 [Longimicrobium sp.]|jgi:hypothetical protein|nr:hypothetical protein [Longimicrobium sp.]
MPDESSALNPSTSRREFAKTALAAVAVPVLAPLAGCAPAHVPTPAPVPAEASTPVAAPASPVAPSAPPQRQGEQERDPVALHLTEALKAKYRDRLTDAQWDEVRKSVEGNLRAARALRSFEIPIQTEPAFVFRAYRGGGR